MPFLVSVKPKGILRLNDDPRAWPGDHHTFRFSYSRAAQHALGPKAAAAAGMGVADAVLFVL